MLTLRNSARDQIMNIWPTFCSSDIFLQGLLRPLFSGFVEMNGAGLLEDGLVGAERDPGEDAEDRQQNEESPKRHGVTIA